MGQPRTPGPGKKIETAKCERAEREGAERASYTSGQMLEKAPGTCHFLPHLEPPGVATTCRASIGKSFPARQIGHDMVVHERSEDHVARCAPEPATSTATRCSLSPARRSLVGPPTSAGAHACQRVASPAISMRFALMSRSGKPMVCGARILGFNGNGMRPLLRYQGKWPCPSHISNRSLT
jgi:hypothetical protein